jgi:hypothetical protein
LKKSIDIAAPLTVLEIATDIGKPQSRVKAAIARLDLEPARVVAGTRLYPAGTLELVRAEIERIDRGLHRPHRKAANVEPES